MDRIPIHPTNPEIDDPNPRGNARGGRGIAVVEDEVIVASYHTLKVFNRQLQLVRDISHPLMAGIHEVFAFDSKSIWVTSTSIDAALQFDLQKGELVRDIWPREIAGFQRTFGVTPLRIDKAADNRTRFLKHDQAGHLHLNAVTTWQGEMLALFNSFGAVVNLDRGETLIRDPGIRGAHNLLLWKDGTVLMNDTRGSSVRVYDLWERKQRKMIDLKRFPFVRSLAPKDWRSSRAGGYLRTILKRAGLRMHTVAKPLFVRGLDRMDDFVFVGVSPASILCIDAKTWDLVDAFQYSDDVRVAVHGLKVVPP